MRLYDAFMVCDRVKLAQEISQILPTESNPTKEQLSKASHKLVEASFARMFNTVPSGDKTSMLSMTLSVLRLKLSRSGKIIIRPILL